MRRVLIWLLAVVLLTACASKKNNILFIPDPEQDNLHGQTDLPEYRQIMESENGPGESGLPAWVRSYLDGGVRGIESLDAYRAKYTFVGKSQGDNLNVLRQWANGFTATQDLPRLIAQRTERRLVTAAVLYPDDEYGEYFERFIKIMSDGEYPDALKEETFWLKQKIKAVSEADAFDDNLPQKDIFFERYEFLVLMSIDRETLRKQIEEIMAGIKTKASPTRNQTHAINKIRQNFFEGF
jgi:hypothetical protein